MKRFKSRGIYRILFYMSRYGRYPDGIAPNMLEARFDKDIVSELRYYNYLEETSKGTIRITIHGREALKTHVLTVVNVLTALLALGVAVLALLLQQQVQSVNLPQQTVDNIRVTFDDPSQLPVVRLMPPLHIAL